MVREIIHSFLGRSLFVLVPYHQNDTFLHSKDQAVTLGQKRNTARHLNSEGVGQTDMQRRESRELALKAVFGLQ